MTIAQFMKKTNVTKKQYVLDWLEAGLIPGARLVDGVWDIPESARRPYRSRCGVNAKASTICTAMVNACLQRQHIMAATFPQLDQTEFDAYIAQLAAADLIALRQADGVTYYDSTAKSRTMEGEGWKKLQKFVVLCLGAVAEHAAYGTAKACLAGQSAA